MSPVSVYLVGVESLASWFTHFVQWRPGDRQVHLGEGPRVGAETLRRGFDGLSAATAVFLTSHDTLLRDRQLAAGLRAAGHRAIVQSAGAATLGIDKVAMKRFFDRHGIPTAPWHYQGEGTLADADGDPLVVKGRNSTQSIGIRMATEVSASPQCFTERYADGVEYSVVAHRTAGRTITLPPVWKGSTSPMLVPPWRRLRLCPAPGITPHLDAWLREVTETIARTADVDGYLEVEFLVQADGAGLVLEINPRICGTLRIAALAADVPVFSLHHLPSSAALPAHRYAAEVPYTGTPFNNPSHQVYATSRLTVAAKDPATAVTALRRHAGDSALLCDPWTTGNAPAVLGAREETPL
ncbi:ATP-grasp domain-containing protein [Micromonospora sp. WMMD1082]|uniref:ATP-grasp domain-containing protein n=1 Tax=Micromonospora sp. WMMD1082 TaxID=3016104 RepID=UPI0024166C69|nr:ATP-grasp domain-containing protein [Micromonospora sp. WMMD1082]MDG4797039.1 ATP-grasp domain-containing protein [Micromonospora sp. WMMD1082]